MDNALIIIETMMYNSPAGALYHTLTFVLYKGATL